jgi:hypothetical protein
MVYFWNQCVAAMLISTKTVFCWFILSFFVYNSHFAMLKNFNFDLLIHIVGTVLTFLFVTILSAYFLFVVPISFLLYVIMYYYI